jgi:formate dehydrogenase maturation protein FdhE
MNHKGCPDEYPISLLINGYEIAVFQLTKYNLDDWTYGYLFSEGGAVSQIQVCEECNGYIKIIDIRQYIEKPSAALLDLNSIHLDYVAQENGYHAVGEKKDLN